MPNLRKPIARVPPTTSGANTSKSNNNSKESSHFKSLNDDKDGSSDILLSPKHIHVPEIPVDGNVVFEGLVFIYGVIGLFLQYVNMYKTVWWLPHSHTTAALNFYLIDPYVVVLLVILLSRRLIFTIINEVCNLNGTSKKWYMDLISRILQMFKLTIVCVMCGILLVTVYQVMLKHSLIYTLFLCYPLITYFVLFGFNIKPLFGKMLLCPIAVNSELPPSRGRGRMERDTLHACSTSPEIIREEVDLLKTDFNQRLKQILFNSMTVAYYVGFVPLCFAQNLTLGSDSEWNTLYYDRVWAVQYIIITWLSSLIMYAVHLLPTKYLNTLHQSSMHLGRWVKVESRNAHVPYNAWSELQVWPKGSTVKHVRGLFKAEGIVNSAEPGKSMHSRFYFVFHQPLRVMNWTLGLIWILVFSQFVLLIQAVKWSQIIALAFQLLGNYYELFKLMRDRFVLGRAYRIDPVSS